MARSTEERTRAADPVSRDLDRAVEDARKGDAAAFRLLYREFQPLLLRYLRVLAGDRADDVSARAWQRAAAGLGARRGGYGEFRGWLAGLARELAHDEPGHGGYARGGYARGGFAPSGSGGGSGAGPDATDAALGMIAELPSEEAEAVLLRSVLGLDARRAARVCGQRPRAVRAAARRGLSALAGRL